MTEYRIEHDSMGEVRVPVDAKWGAQTQRAVENFPISGLPIERRLIRALALDQGRRRRVNARLRGARRRRRSATRSPRAPTRSPDGRWDDQFPIDVYQTGSGTSSNMNINEVLATLATERLGAPVHPNDHVNASQSSNDVFPSAIHLAATEAVVVDLIPAALGTWPIALRRKQREFEEVVKSGRTHLMDATPVTLGQEFGGYAAQVEDAIARLEDALPASASSPRRHRRRHGHQRAEGLRPQGDRASRDAHRPAAHRGPRPLRGAGRARRPGRGVGRAAHARSRSSRSPTTCAGWAAGRAPAWPRSASPICSPARRSCPARSTRSSPRPSPRSSAQVIGNDAAVAFGGAQGNFELNVFVPVMARNLLESIRLLANVSRPVRRQVHRRHRGQRRALQGLRRVVAVDRHVAQPLHRLRELAKVIKESARTGKSIRQIVLARKLMTEAELDRALDVALSCGGALLARRTVRDLRGDREAAPARDRCAGVGVRRARLQHRCRVAVVSHRPDRSQPAAGRRTWWQFIRGTKNPELPVVLLEDFGALVGLVFALAGVTLAEVFHQPRFDALGSLAIGVLLVGVAIVLAIEMASLLIGEAASPDDVATISDALVGAPSVRRLIHLLSCIWYPLGPRRSGGVAGCRVGAACPPSFFPLFSGPRWRPYFGARERRTCATEGELTNSTHS